MYLDTAILVKLVVPEPDSAFYATLVEGREDVWSSSVLMIEAYSALRRKEREGSIRPAQGRTAWQQIESYVERGSLTLVPLSMQLLERANQLLEACHPKVALRSLDAMHLAAFADCASPPLVTNDKVLRAAARHLRLELGPIATAG